MGQAFVDTLNRRRATFIYLTPAHLHALLEALPAGGPPLLPAVRVLRAGSMPISQGTVIRTIERLSPNLVTSYGTNDTDSRIALAEAACLTRYPGCAGTVCPGVELQIVDPDGREVPRGAMGEVRVRVPDMPAGYIDDPEASARSFRDGWFHPGDLAVMNDEGVLFLKGRTDDLMNFQGMKVLPADIEEAMLEHPDVAEAAAFPLYSERDQHVPVVAVVLREGRQGRGRDLVQWAARQLAGRSPARIFVLARLPRNAAGKVDRRALARDALRHLREKRR
jgi:acyl-CoA synthetase (AMP-forming)/AMP-acid ligase II